MMSLKWRRCGVRFGVVSAEVGTLWYCCTEFWRRDPPVSCRRLSGEKRPTGDLGERRDGNVGME